MRVHTVLPPALAAAVDAVLRDTPLELEHVAHRKGPMMSVAERVVADADAVALIGPYRSAAVAEVVDVTAPAGLALLAPAATWAGVTRDDEPGTDDAARHRGTVLRMVARDTEVARRVADGIREGGRRAFVVAGDHPYGRQLDAQLRLADLPRAERPQDADLVVLCGLRDRPEIERARALAPLPLVAFDGVQGADLGQRDAWLALPHAPVEGMRTEDVLAGVHQARRAALLVEEAVVDGATDRAAMLTALRRLGGFDEHGDPPEPPVSLWRIERDWALEPHRPI